MRVFSSRSLKARKESRRWEFRTTMITAALVVSVVALTMLANPAAAHEWNVESESTSCHTYSFGTLCVVTQTLFRHHNPYCTAGQPSDWQEKIVWGTFCYRNGSYSYWP